MNKSILSFIVAFTIGLSGLHAQCVPNTSYTQPGYYPDSIPHDTVGVAYSTVIQIKVLTDTTISGFPAVVDSILLDSVAGLPAGFNYACNPASKSFPGGSNGCLLISGAAPTEGMIGSHPLIFYVTAYGKLGGSIPAHYSYTITSYNIHIDPGATGIVNLSSARFDLSQNFPDPATNLTNIYYSVPVGTPLDFKMYNLLGKIVYQKSFFAARGTGSITLDAKDFAPGIYMYNLSNGKTTLTRRMVMANN